MLSAYQSYIHQSRYARWIESENRRETWDETVERYCDFFAKRFKDFPYELIYNAIVTMQVMPSMRCLMTAGEALERDEMAGYNPVSADTKVLTREYGLVPIEQLEGRCATVLNKDGRWAEATFRGYGVQPTKRVRFRRNSNTELHVDCTANHRWVLTTGEVKSTATLAVGDTIPHAAAPKPALDEDYLLGVRHGIVYGDGTALRSAKRVKGFAIRMCGDSAELLEYFEGYPRSYPPSFGGDPVVYMFDAFAATHDLKSLPADDESESYKLGFIRGLLAADGSVSSGSQVTLCGSKDVVDWLKTNGEQLGFIVQRVAIFPSTTNFGERTRDTFSMHLHRDGLVPEDFLCSWKRANFRQLTSTYKVVGIEDNTPCPVYCAEVPDTNTFVLEGGIVTGNCSYIAVDNPRVFDEILYILMCGTGVGFSVERQNITQLPSVPKYLSEESVEITVEDSKIGWATALRSLIGLLYCGTIPSYNVSKLRPAGSRLKTFGGRASGPAPLVELFNFVIATFKKAAGRKLTSIECHDIVCKIADSVVVGGVRRSALISLSNLSDTRMRTAKSGQWWVDEPQRALANNSVAYTEKPEMLRFIHEWTALIESRSGERGIFNRQSAKNKAISNGRRNPEQEFGCNPCAEINLPSCGLCNLTEAIARAEDTLDTLKHKIELATILGTFQSTLTNFRYVRPLWRENAEAERLLGVSLTGINDCPALLNASPHELTALRDHAIAVNKKWASILGISPSVAVTTVKPSGTVSQLVDCASGIHERFSQYYIRRIRADATDPLARFMIDNGFSFEYCDKNKEKTVIFSFPIVSPGTRTGKNKTAIEQLELYKKFYEHWCEHNVSVTITVKDEEWLGVGDWVYQNWESIGGVSFLPYSDHVYVQPPYEACSQETYERLRQSLPSIDFSMLHESEDGTTRVKELACSGGMCEL